MDQGFKGMRVITSVSFMRRLSQKAGRERKTIGFVPTMGCLHEGHASLLRKSKKENDITVLSIFVNPKQFTPTEDFARYPRDFKKDELLAKNQKVDIIFHPSAEEIYPEGYLTAVEVEGLSDILCGKFRPGHFRGVTTVVLKLLNIVSPHRLYLGQKDAQQAVIIQKMVEDLNVPVKVKVLPTVREEDGLAMSSRNAYLTAQERQEARILFEALNLATTKILSGERDSKNIVGMIRDLIRSKTQTSRIDYIECVDARSLEPLTILSGDILIALAVWFGAARLIDNICVRLP